MLYVSSIFNFFSLNIHFRCLNIYFFQDKMFHGSNPIISWNKTDTGAFFKMISRIFTEYDKNCFTFKVIHIVLLVHIYIYVSYIWPNGWTKYAYVCKYDYFRFFVFLCVLFMSG